MKLKHYKDNNWDYYIDFLGRIQGEYCYNDQKYKAYFNYKNSLRDGEVIRITKQ